MERMIEWRNSTLLSFTLFAPLRFSPVLKLILKDLGIDFHNPRLQPFLHIGNGFVVNARAIDMHITPEIDPNAVMLFIINGSSGASDANIKRDAIQSALDLAGRQGDLIFCDPAELDRVAKDAAAKAIASRTALVAVGGDGTINAVAQAAHAAGCAMGVIPQGTFNYFARTHGIPSDPTEATRMLCIGEPTPVQVAAINDRVFLVNASVGLYPELLEDRETYKARFGRSRLVAFGAAIVTLLRAQRRLRLHIELGASVRDVQTLTLFVGNNRLQLEQFGVQPMSLTTAGRITAVMLRPIGTLAMLRLMLHGAMGTLGEAESVERFDFNHMVVKPSLAHGRRGVKVAFDGEVARMRAPLDFRVLPEPLYLMKAPQLMQDKSHENSDQGDTAR
jgi:diacylglycerol kinase family enzyme